MEQKIPAKIEGVSEEFKDVSAEPMGLPTWREKDHAINLQPRIGPISMRPYRYPHVQKSEIEKLVKEMLAAGIIRSSTSPFSSPVLLVRKKNGGGIFVWIIRQ